MTAARARTPKASAAAPVDVVVTHPDKVLFPDDGITKGELVQYYRDVASVLLPYTADRPLTLQRWPNGIAGTTFFEKQVPKGAPDWIATTKQASAGKRAVVDYPLCNDERSLLWFANMAAITLHVWMSRVQTPDQPDFLLFDLDPFEGCTIATLGRVARVLRDELDGVGLVPLVKTTGGKGFHVVVPLAPKVFYDDGRAFNEAVAQRVERLLPKYVTLERSLARRPKGTVYFDWAQLGKGKTYVPPFAVRARPGAPVSTPLTWAEVDTLGAKRSAKPTHEALRAWNLRNVPALVAERGDAWKTARVKPQRLEAALEAARSRWSLPSR